ncbi:MAG TPA: hypothetical protein VF147_04045, partial [Vicinamibacterales bacterium]
EVSDIRRRVRTAIDAARLRASERRARATEAKREYETFLEQRAIPAFHQFAAALVGEGFLYKVFTPAGTVRLAAERSPDEFLELGLDDTADPPQVVLRTSRGRGRRIIEDVKELTGPAQSLTDEDVIAILLKEIVPFLER